MKIQKLYKKLTPYSHPHKFYKYMGTLRGKKRVNSKLLLPNKNFRTLLKIFKLKDYVDQIGFQNLDLKSKLMLD